MHWCVLSSHPRRPLQLSNIRADKIPVHSDFLCRLCTFSFWRENRQVHDFDENRHNIGNKLQLCDCRFLVDRNWGAALLNPFASSTVDLRWVVEICSGCFGTCLVVGLGTGFYGSNDPTNSVKALKEGRSWRLGFNPIPLVPNMAHNVFGGTLNLTQL